MEEKKKDKDNDEEKQMEVIMEELIKFVTVSGTNQPMSH